MGASTTRVGISTVPMRQEDWISTVIEEGIVALATTFQA
jgi:hypothetical protein